MNNQIITSLLDSDLYKFTMLYAIWKQGNNKVARYEFNNRNKEPFTVKQVDEICHQIGLFRTLRFTSEDVKYLESLELFDPNFLSFLDNYDLSKTPCPVVALKNGQLNITLVGPWQETILYEVPVLSIVNEVYFADKTKSHFSMAYHIDKCRGYNEINFIANDLKIAEFGTRRRFSKLWQDQILEQMVKINNGWLVGTSNVFLAKKYNIPAIGTMAHEYLQAFQVISGTNFDFHINHALDAWTKVYRGKLAVALTDSINTETFINTTYMQWNDWTGFRHDSGCPIDWGQMIIAQPEYKGQTLVFSDGLNPASVRKIWHKFACNYPVVFGIGTDFTNDCGRQALNIVMKMQEYDGIPVSKISDEPGKMQGVNAQEIKEHFDRLNNTIKGDFAIR